LWLTVLGEAVLPSKSNVVTLGVVPEPLRDPADDETDEASAVVTSDKAGTEEEGE